MKKYPDDFNEWILKNFKTDFKHRTAAHLGSYEPNATFGYVSKKINTLDFNTSMPNKYKLIEDSKKEIQRKMLKKYSKNTLLTFPTVNIKTDEKFFIIKVGFWYRG
jgi:plasmid replication initiation protein